MTQAERAQALGITVRHLRKLEARGCPTDLEGARAWRAQHIEPRLRDVDEPGAVTSALEAALRELAKSATPEALRAAVVAFTRALRDRRLDEQAIAGYFGALCSSLEIRDRWTPRK